MRNLSGSFEMKIADTQKNGLFPLFFNYALKDVIRKWQKELEK